MATFSLVLLCSTLLFFRVHGEDILSNFGYVSQGKVTSELLLAWDVAAMRNAFDNNQKKQIYTNKSNKNTGTLTLQSLSLQSVKKYANYPLYNIYRSTFSELGRTVEGDKTGMFDGHPVENYADTLINDLFYLNIANIEAEAVVALNLFMALYGALYDFLDGCKVQNVERMLQGLDQAAAFWIGEGQVRGDSQTGYFFYNLAQFVGEKFNQNSPGDTEVVVNIKVISELVSLQRNVTNDEIECGTQEGFVRARSRVSKLVSYANQVLMQMLIHRTRNFSPGGGPTDFVEMYSLSLMPQIAACDTDLYMAIERFTVTLNVDETTMNDLISDLQQAYSCLGLSCEQVGAYMVNVVPQCVGSSGVLPLAGYEPQEDVRILSRIDRDIRQIRMNMEFGAREAAKELYMFGQNSFFTLRELANGETTAEVSQVFQQTMQLLGAGSNDRSFVHNIIMKVLDRSAPFTSATNEQLSAYLDSLLRGVVIFLGVTNELEQAINILGGTSDGTPEDAMQSWDNGVALFIGSTEGLHIGGSQDGGESLFGLANRMCIIFHECGSDGKAIINDKFLFAFGAGAAAIKDKDPTAAEEAYNNDILPNIIVPVLQGMLNAVVRSGDNPSGPFRGETYGYSQAVLGFFQGKASTSGLQSALLQPPSSTSTDAVFTQVETILASPSVQTDCANVGDIADASKKARNVCKGVDATVPAPRPTTPPPVRRPQPTPPPVPVTRGPEQPRPGIAPSPLGLAWGKFQFSDVTVANNDAKVAQALKAMWSSGNVQQATAAYNNTEIFSSGLYRLPSVTSLAAMSTMAKTIMPNDPIYNFYRYALYDDPLFDEPDSTDVWAFADSVVKQALNPQKGNSAVLAAEAVIVLHSYFIILRQLHESSRQCRTGNAADALKFLDSAVAIWIGEEQTNGGYNTGYLMYSMAQLARNQFRLPEQEAYANTKLMNLFNSVKTILSSQCTATQQPGAYNRIRMKITEIAAALTLPLVQQLLYYISTGDKKFTEMLALAVVPQVSACSVGDFSYLKLELMNGKIFDSSGEDQALAMEDLARGLHCLGITCDELGDASKADRAMLSQMVDYTCEYLKGVTGNAYIAGYETTSNVYDLSRLDLDVHRVSILMRTGALNAAKEIYELGYSSKQSADQYYTLKALSDAATASSAGKLANQYSSYYSNIKNFPHDYVNQIISNADGPFKSASRSQKAEAVYRMLQSSTIYLAIAAKIESAQKMCVAGQQGDKAIDEAAALFAGSIEGTRSGGSDTNSGVLLMGLGKEVCSAFDKCESAGDSFSNEFIIFALSDMKQWLSSRDCNSAAAVKDESLLPMLSVSIIQAILDLAYLSGSLSASSDDEKLSALDAFAKAILPQVNAANATSAAIISDATDFKPGVKRIPNGAKEIFDAFAYVVRPLGIDCNVIGVLQSVGLSTCDVKIVAPPPETPTTLGANATIIYRSTTYVQDRADIALDVKQMQENLELGKKPSAELIYKEGQNSAVYDKFGIKVNLRSLSLFSTNASETMKSNPLFQTAVYALKDGSNMYLGEPATQYADSVVQEAFGKSAITILPAEAAVSLNLWMEVANELFETLDNCKNQRIHDEDGIHSIDEVAAYWIGDGEIAGNAQEGHLLYNLAERMGLQFGTLDKSGKATANLKFLRLLNEARLTLSFPESCSEDFSTVRKLQRLVNKIVTQMLIVQVQTLISAILKNDRDRVRVFAHGYVPFIKACDSGTFGFMNDKLLAASYSATEVDSIITRIYGTLPCYDITCEDIGYLQEAETSAVCEDQSTASLAGFRPSEQLFDYARLDLDIVLIDILMAQEAYSVAKDIYMFGRNTSPDGSSSLSLQSLAKSTRRSNIPEYNTFVQYFAGDSNYADTMILGALESQTMPVYQRRAIVVQGAQYMVMYMGILEQMFNAVQECKAKRQTSASQQWDKAASYIIGSLEGAVDEPYEKRGGVFIWGLAKKHCKEFGTCRNIMTGAPPLNQRIRSLLYTGRGAVSSGGCDALEKTANELIPLLRVPLVQSALSEITMMAQNQKGPVRDMHHIQANLAAQSLLPLIEKGDRNTADLIKKNLDMLGDPLHDTAEVVALGFVSSFGALQIDCEYVGNSENIKTCSGEVQSFAKERVPMFVGIGLGLIFGGVMAIALFLLQSKRRKSQLPEQPKFVRNKQGVMDEADRDFSPDGSNSNRSGVATDAIDFSNGANAAKENFTDVDLPEAV